MKLWLVRHALTTAAEGECYGRSDVTASPEMTQGVAERVAPLLPRGLALRSSPLRRCAELAHAIASLQNGDGPLIDPQLDPRLAEMDFGAWEGRPWRAIDRVEFDRWMTDFADAPAGGVGESTRTFMQRVGQAFDEWRAGGEDAIWVTHAGVIRAVWLLGEGVRVARTADQWPSKAIAFGECVTVDVR